MTNTLARRNDTSLTLEDRIISTRELDLIRRALISARDEIHNPGCAKANNYDVLDLIDQALSMPLLGAGAPKTT